MALQCGKNLEQESVKSSQKDMKSLMRKGKSMFSKLKESNALKQLDIKKLEKIPKKLNEVVITGYTNKVTVPEDTFLIASVYGKKAGSGMKFLIIDYTYNKEKYIVSTSEKVSELIVTALVPDGTEEVNLQSEVSKLQGTKDINSFMAKAQEIQLKFGSATPAPSTADVEETAENTSTINLSDKPINVLKVLIMTNNNNFYGGTTSFKLEDTVITLHEPGEPNKLREVKKIKVKYTVPGTSSVAMGSKGNFDINQILAKVTKDKNFTTNDLKSLDNAKVKGLMGSYQKDIGKGINNLDTSKMGAPEKDLLNQFKGGIGTDGKLNLDNLNFKNIFGTASKIANSSAKGKIEETAVSKMLSGDLAGAFNEGVKLRDMGGPKFPGIPTSFDLSKIGKDPTSALASLLSLQTARPSTSELRQVDYSSKSLGGNTIKSVTLSKTIIQIIKVEGQKAGTNLYSSVNFKRNGNRIITTDSYNQIKVTYKTPAPELKPGEAFSKRKLDTCKDLPDIKVVLPKLSKFDIAQGKTLSDVSSIVPLSKPKKVPQEKPKASSVDVESLKLSAKEPFRAFVSKADLDLVDEFIALVAMPINSYYYSKIGEVTKELKTLQATPEWQQILNIKRNKANTVFTVKKLIELGKFTPEQVSILQKAQPIQKRYIQLVIQYTDGSIFVDSGVRKTVRDLLIVTSLTNANREVVEIAERGGDSYLAAFRKGVVAAGEAKIKKLTKITLELNDPSIISDEEIVEIKKAIDRANFKLPSVEESNKYKNAYIKYEFRKEEINQAIIHDLENNYKVN